MLWFRDARWGAALLSALLLLTLLGCGSSGPQGAASPTPRPLLTPTPTLDPQSQAYITLLRTYYLPMASGSVPVVNCYHDVLNSSKSQQPQAIQVCRPLAADELALAQTLKTQLAAASPPARWQTQHAALQKAVDGMIALETEIIAAVDAGDVTRFLRTDGLAIDTFSAFCPVIAQLNAGPPPLSPHLPAPNSNACT